ncbi:MAG TPA: hypothetical protein PKE58_14450 [Acidobacteriota bacterium]|nr:hypothetical protein [Acidobacteriota bacterium]
MKTRLKILLLLGFLYLLPGTQSTQSVSGNPTRTIVSYCWVSHHPQSFDGKIISVSGILSIYPNAMALSDPACVLEPDNPTCRLMQADDFQPDPETDRQQKMAEVIVQGKFSYDKYDCFQPKFTLVISEIKPLSEAFDQ